VRSPSNGNPRPALSELAKELAGIGATDLSDVTTLAFSEDRVERPESSATATDAG